MVVVVEDDDSMREAIERLLDAAGFGCTAFSSADALHADLKGGDGLLAWYAKRGMAVLPKDEKLPVGPRRLFAPSDGRYCYYTVPAAVAASRELDDLR
jgi:hypothetical protein